MPKTKSHQNNISAPGSGITKHRKYHRISTFTPDQQTFINYLLQRRYDLTLKIFQEEIEDEGRRSCFNWLDKMDSKEGSIGVEEFRNIVDGIRGSPGGQGKDWIRLEFMLIVWLCSRDKDKISPENIKLLRNFIQKNGIKLSQSPDLLPYFALPYIQDSASHPFLRKIYTPQWKQQVKQFIKQYCQPQPQPQLQPQCMNQQGQWYTIVKDLIEICLYLSEEVELKDSSHQQKIERVRKYQRVIQQNDGSMHNSPGQQQEQESMKPSQLSRLVFLPIPAGQQEAKSIESISSVHQKQPEPLHFEALKQSLYKLNTGKSKQHRELCLLYSGLHARILEAPIASRPSIIQSYIEHDIFSLGSSPQLNKLQQIECLKLMNTMCSLNRSIRYLAASQEFISMLCKIVVRDKGYYLQGSKNNKEEGGLGVEERLFEVFGILQKVLLSKQVVAKVMKTQLVSVLVLNYAANFQILPKSILTYVLALILNIILKPEGKMHCSALKCPLPKASTGPKHKQHPLSLFELVVKIWKYLISPTPTAMASSNPSNEQTQLQSLIYSILYVLLSVESNKQIARAIKFKAMMENFVQQNDDQYHRKVVESIVEVLGRQESDDSWMEGDGNVDHADLDDQDDDQMDQIGYDEEDVGLLWVGNRVSNLQPNESKSRLIEKFNVCNQNIRNLSKPKQSEVNPKQNKPQNLVKSQNLYINNSTPLENINNLDRLKPINGQKDKKKTEEAIINNSAQYDKVSGYDPTKYEAWKRLKTSKN